MAVTRRGKGGSMEDSDRISRKVRLWMQIGCLSKENDLCCRDERNQVLGPFESHTSKLAALTRCSEFGETKCS